jgi:hypothetical protein
MFFTVVLFVVAKMVAPWVGVVMWLLVQVLAQSTPMRSTSEVRFFRSVSDRAHEVTAASQAPWANAKFAGEKGKRIDTRGLAQLKYEWPCAVPCENRAGVNKFPWGRCIK